MTLADAVPPVPPSLDVTALVVLSFVPAVSAVTFTVNVQEAVAATIAPDKLIAPEPADAVMVPPPHDPVSPFGVEITRPLGRASANATPDNADDPFGFVTVKASDVVAFSPMLADPNDFAMVGGRVPGAVTPRSADAVPPLPPSVEVTVLVVLVFVPSEVTFTVTLKVHEALAASVAPDRVTDPDPAVAVMVPPPQEPVNPFGVETMRPEGKVSVKATPVSAEDAFGFVIVKFRIVVPLRTILELVNPFAMLGGATTAPAVVILPMMSR